MELIANVMHSCQVIGHTIAMADGSKRYVVDLGLVTATSPDPADERRSVLRMTISQAQELIGALSELVAQHQAPPPKTLQ